MKIIFDASQQHQIAPVEHVRDIAAAAVQHRPRPATPSNPLTLFASAEEPWIDPDLALEAINHIRAAAGDSIMPPLDQLEIPAHGTVEGGLDLSIEMETGTGKTYAYLRTIFALSEAKGLRAFVIVVPSIAIREGVLKTIELTRSHFAVLYGGRRLDAFVYTSDRPGAVRNFGDAAGGIDVMIVTLDSFNKDSNVLRQMTESGGGAALIDRISAARPVVILDEPQNMGSEKSQEALNLLRPLMTLRYSATHRDIVNLIYRLTPAMARKAGLVKAVEVVSVEEAGVRDRPFVRLKALRAARGSWSASLEVETLSEGMIRRKAVTVGLNGKDDAKRDLFALSGERPTYRDRWVVTGIDAQGVTFENGEVLRPNAELGADREIIFRAQIRLTIQRHIEKQREAARHGVKILSLFFIDRVANWSDEDGIIRRLFAQEFEAARSHPDFPAAWQDLAVADVVEGYFATKPKKNGAFELLDTSGRQGDADAEKRAYDLIMKGKEDLLSFPRDGDETETARRRRVAFVVSHSALREGWDNPNVFQICTLAEATSTIRKRQEIGRGVRIPVDQSGARVHDPDLNVLTVLANQSYEAFVRDYQAECAASGVDDDAPKNGAKRQKTKIRVQQDVAIDPAFQELWRRASRRTMWRVDLDTETIVRKVHARMDEIDRFVKAPLIRVVRARIEDDDLGGDRLDKKRDYKTRDYTTAAAMHDTAEIPDVIELIAQALCREKTRLAISSRTIARICSNPTAIAGIIRNPTQWASRAAQVIRDVVEGEAVDGVKYEETGEEWELSRLTRHEREVLVETVEAGPRGLYDRVAIDSEPEKIIVDELRTRSEPMGTVRAFLKLPPWFRVETPVGTYNPDFAVVKKDDESGKHTIFLVREVKGANKDGRTPRFGEEERRKIACAHQHFAPNIDYSVVSHPSDI